MPSKLIEFVILDVDDVVVDTDAAGALAMRAVDARVGPLLQRHYETLIAHLRGENPPAYAELRRRIEGWQRGFAEVKQWSRECLVAICLEDLGERPTAERVNREGRAYWRAITEHTKIYDDAARLIRRCAERGVAYHLATNSDGFLDFDDRLQTFVYAPADSARRKVERLGLLKSLGVTEQHISVGDPIGKPKREFYEKVLREMEARLGRPIIRERTLAVGDSFAADVEPFMKLGTHGAWLKRKGELEPHAIRTLDEVEV